MARELWFTAPHQVELREASRAPLAPGQVRLRALASGISQGTELLLYRGEGPQPFDPSLDDPARPTYPRRYGYAWVGEVVEVRDAAIELGARVFGLLSHAEEHCVPLRAARPLPAGLPAARSVLAANLETALNAVWDAGICLGDEVLVIGGGVVGALIGHLAKRAGARRVSLSEPSARRRAVALGLGFDEAYEPRALPSDLSDVVVEASGDPACLDDAITRARDEGTIVVASFYGQRVAPVALGAEFHRRRLSLRSSQVSRVSPARGPRWPLDRRFREVTMLLENGDLDALLEPGVPFAQAPSVYAGLAAAPGSRLQTIFDYGST